MNFHEDSSAPLSSGSSRRKLLVSAAVLTGTVVKQHAAGDSSPSKLALHGGHKAARQLSKLPIRWGEPERERWNAMARARRALLLEGSASVAAGRAILSGEIRDALFAGHGVHVSPSSMKVSLWNGTEPLLRLVASRLKRRPRPEFLLARLRLAIPLL